VEVDDHCRGNVWSDGEIHVAGLSSTSFFVSRNIALSEKWGSLSSGNLSTYGSRSASAL